MGLEEVGMVYGGKGVKGWGYSAPSRYVMVL